MFVLLAQVLIPMQPKVRTTIEWKLIDIHTYTPYITVFYAGNVYFSVFLLVQILPIIENWPLA